MKFAIRKTSHWGNGEMPYKTAVQEYVPQYDVRTCTEEYYNNNMPRMRGRETEPRQKWRDTGTEHTVLPNGHISRRMPQDRLIWTIEIESLEQLMALQNEVGSLVISYDNMPSIEIYDTYRE